MLFNSYPFLFVFLPVTLAGFFLIARASHILALGWLTLASLFFYGWWNPVYVTLLLASIAFNFAVGIAIVRDAGTRRARRLLALGVTANLLLLGYYKYADFFVSNLNYLGAGLQLPGVILPLGISFFTFTQIAFLADAAQGKAAEYRFIQYSLFVTYFPHLIAGPVLHHREMMPQFGRAETFRFDWENLAVGFTIFFIGLFKKTVLADGIAVYVRPVFNAPALGAALSASDAWGGALAYTFQLYFDFSGYSDMAIGLSRLFGVTLPLNFNSPYKAANISELWQRWHMTLTRFLRDYVFVPLGGHRKSALRRYFSLFVTMLLCGMWHGAGWTYIVFGIIQGAYLVAYQFWRTLRKRMGHNRRNASRPGLAAGCVLTFVAWVIGLVFFRSDTIGDALAILQAMAGTHGLTLPYRWLDKLGSLGLWLAQHGVRFENTHTFGGGPQLNWIICCALIIWCAPNTQQILRQFRPALGVEPQGSPRWWNWRPAWTWLAYTGLAAALSILSLTSVSEFIYFQF